ncbi:MAG: hypothetical protein ABH886_05840 [Candidatus Desantisbacteria bacterium]
MLVLRYVCIVLALMFSADAAMAAGTATGFKLEAYRDLEHINISDTIDCVTAGSTFTVKVFVVDSNDDYAGMTDPLYNNDKIDIPIHLTWTSTATNSPNGTAVIMPSPRTVPFHLGKVFIPGFVLFNVSETPTTITVRSDDGMTGSVSVMVSAGIQSCFNVVSNGTETAGKGFGIILEMTDIYGNPTVNPNNQATQTLSLDYSWNAINSPNGSSSIPPFSSVATNSITFTNGKASFGTFTPVNAGNKPCISVSCLEGFEISGTSFPIPIQASSPSNLRFSPPATVTAGVDFPLGTITICDRFGNTATTTGSQTVTYIGLEGIPSGTSSLYFNRGISTTSLFTKLLKSTAITMAIGTITGTSNLITVNPGSPTSMEVITENHAEETAGDPFSIILTLKDTYGNIANNCTDSRYITWSWAAGNFPNNETPTKPADELVKFINGRGTTTTDFRLTNAGVYPGITAMSDTISGTLSSITVKPNAAKSFTITAPGTVTAGGSFTLTITALDAFGNIAGYPGTKTITCSGYGTSSPSGALPYLPHEVNFASGTVSLEVKLVKAEETMITITQGTISGTSEKIVVVPAPPVKFILSTEHQGTETAGTAFAITIKADKDAFGNDTSNYTDSRTLSWGGNASNSPLNKPYKLAGETQVFDCGTATATGFTLTNATQTTIWVTDGITSGTTTTITVIPAGVSYLDINLPSPVTVNQPFSINSLIARSLIARDCFGNVANSYSGTKTIIFSGPGADMAGNKPSYPPAIVFIAGVAIQTQILPLTIIFKKPETVSISLYDGYVYGTSNKINVIALSATASVLPHKVYANAATQTINYRVTNTGDSAISQIDITIPSGFTCIIVGTPTTLNQSWSATGNGQYVRLTPGSESLSPGAWLTVPITVQTGENEQLPVKWQSVITNGDGIMVWVQEEKEGDSEVAIIAYSLSVPSDTITCLPSGTATIRVRVVSPQTGTGTSGAFVRFNVIDSQISGTVSTNNDGYATLNIPAGTTTGIVTVEVICGLFNIGTISFQVVSPIPLIISHSEQGVTSAKPSTIFELKPFGNLKQEYKIDNGAWTQLLPFATFTINSPGKHQIFYRYVDESGKAGAESSLIVFITPEPYKLRNFPNPFNPKEGTSIEYPLTTPADIHIQIYNLFGELVWMKEILAGQEWDHKWDGRNGDGEVVGNGSYICRVTIKYPSGDVVMVRRIGVVK